MLTYILAALVLKPRVNLTCFYIVFAANRQCFALVTDQAW